MNAVEAEMKLAMDMLRDAKLMLKENRLRFFLKISNIEVG